MAAEEELLLQSLSEGDEERPAWAATVGELFVTRRLPRAIFPVADLRSRSWAMERVILLSPAAVQWPSFVPTLAPANGAEKLIFH